MFVVQFFSSHSSAFYSSSHSHCFRSSAASILSPSIEAEDDDDDDDEDHFQAQDHFYFYFHDDFIDGGAFLSPSLITSLLTHSFHLLFQLHHLAFHLPF